METKREKATIWEERTEDSRGEKDEDEGQDSTGRGGGRRDEEMKE